jgi:hypothetical protein
MHIRTVNDNWKWNIIMGKMAVFFYLRRSIFPLLPPSFTFRVCTDFPMSPPPKLVLLHSISQTHIRTFGWRKFVLFSFFALPAAKAAMTSKASGWEARTCTEREQTCEGEERGAIVGKLEDGNGESDCVNEAMSSLNGTACIWHQMLLFHSCSSDREKKTMKFVAPEY